MPISYFPPLVSNLDWGKLTGEISTQSDLAAALAQKANVNHTHQEFIVLEKTTAQAIDSTNYTEITGLQFALTADEYYEIELMLLVNKSVNTEANDLRLRCEITPEIVYLACFTANDSAMKNILSDEIFTTTGYLEISNINDTLLGRFLYLKARFKALANGTFCIKAAISSVGDEIEIGKGSFVNYK
ncbi:MAG: hypothetical protein WCR42_13235 [bacterium]